MRVDVAARITEPVTFVRRPDRGADAWECQTYPMCDWQEADARTLSSDGSSGDLPSVVVQVPEDQGDPHAALGDWVVRGTFVPTFAGAVLTTSELLSQLPAASGRIMRQRDLTGGLSGLQGPIMRYASVRVYEAGQ